MVRRTAPETVISPPLPSVLTIKEAADDLKVGTHVLWNWHMRGQLPFLYTNPESLATRSRRRGPKGARIERGEWERFKAGLAVWIDPLPPESDEDDLPPPPEPPQSRRRRPRRKFAD
mgnify:CR=1 FL=1